MQNFMSSTTLNPARFEWKYGSYTPKIVFPAIFCEPCQGPYVFSIPFSIT